MNCLVDTKLSVTQSCMKSMAGREHSCGFPKSSYSCVRALAMQLILCKFRWIWGPRPRIDRLRTPMSVIAESRDGCDLQHSELAPFTTLLMFRDVNCELLRAWASPLSKIKTKNMAQVKGVGAVATKACFSEFGYILYCKMIIAGDSTYL